MLPLFVPFHQHVSQSHLPALNLDSIQTSNLCGFVLLMHLTTLILNSEREKKTRRDGKYKMCVGFSMPCSRFHTYTECGIPRLDRSVNLTSGCTLCYLSTENEKNGNNNNNYNEHKHLISLPLFRIPNIYKISFLSSNNMLFSLLLTTSIDGIRRFHASSSIFLSFSSSHHLAYGMKSHCGIFTLQHYLMLCVCVVTRE